MSKRNFISNYLHLNKGRGWDRGLRFVALCNTKSNVFESETMSKLSDVFVRQRPESPAIIVSSKIPKKCHMW